MTSRQDVQDAIDAIGPVSNAAIRKALTLMADRQAELARAVRTAVGSGEAWKREQGARDILFEAFEELRGTP